MREDGATTDHCFFFPYNNNNNKSRKLRRIDETCLSLMSSTDLFRNRGLQFRFVSLSLSLSPEFDLFENAWYERKREREKFVFIESISCKETIVSDNNFSSPFTSWVAFSSSKTSTRWSNNSMDMQVFLTTPTNRRTIQLNRKVSYDLLIFILIESAQMWSFQQKKYLCIDFLFKRSHHLLIDIHSPSSNRASMMLSADECFIARDILFPDRIHTRARERERKTLHSFKTLFWIDLLVFFFFFFFSCESEGHQYVERYTKLLSLSLSCD